PKANSAIKLLSYSLLDFNYQNFLEAYKTLEYLALQYRIYYEVTVEIMENIEADFELKTAKARDLNKFQDIINRLRWLDCNCIYPKLGILAMLRDQRNAKKKADTIFQNYVTAHPGLEHYAGVPQNGTLFLVYSTTKLYNAGPANQVVADFASDKTCCDVCYTEFTKEMDPPLIATDNEEIILSGDLDNQGELIINILNDDYFSGNPDKKPDDVLIEPLTISIGGRVQYNYINLGTIAIRTTNSGPVIAYTQNQPDKKVEAKATIDFFFLKITDNKTKSVDYCTLCVLVKQPSSGIINTKPDKAAVLAGKKVKINLQVNDNSDYKPGTLTVYLSHYYGGPSP
ncbi:MAG TPA: hypothetical protein VFJ43_09165, partial [Bacteroidia bacterium]|nr:hypothetical protein [Bacteroidia bacterium]